MSRKSLIEQVDVLTVTKRTGWEETALQSLEKQTHQNINWLVVSQEEVEVPYIPAPKKKYMSTLNASHNEGLKRCTNDYVVFMQDFIELEPDTIEKLLKAAKETDGFVSTTPYNPNGNLDHRNTGTGGVRECEPKQWEINVAIAPMKALKDLGGFDEEYDKGWSWDNVNIADRAFLLGYKFYIDESIKPTLLYHPKEPDLHPELVLNHERHEETMRAIARGERPIKLEYLH